MGSRNRRPARLATVLFAAALTAAACGGATTTAGPAATSTPLASGPLDRSNLAALVATTVPDPSQVGPLAAALSGADRTQVNAAAISPSIPALEAIQDQDAMKALQELQAKQAAAYSPSGLVQTAAWRPAVTRPLQHPSGALLATTETLVIAIVGSAVDAYDPRVDTSPQPLSQDFTDSSGGVDTSMRVTLTTSSGSGRFTAALAVDGDTTKTDPSSGAVVGRVVGTSNFVVSLNPCPDAAGLVSGHIAIEDDETDSGSAVASGSMSVGFKYTGSGDFTTTVNDQAEIASTHFSAEVDRAVTTATQAAGSTEPDLTSTDLGLHFDQTVTGSAGGATDAQVTNAQGPVSAEDGRAVASAFTIGIEAPALALAAFASNVWKGGKCFEIRPSPDGGDVGPGSQTQIKVTVYHWVDKAEVKLPVKATLAGTKTVDPSGVDQTAPATFTFTSGQPNSTGDITYRVVSKRGIGELTSHFKVQSGLNLDISGTLVEGTQLGTYHLKISGTGIQVRANPDNSLTATGTVTVSGTVTIPLEGCTGTVNEHIGVIGQGMLTGPDDAPVFHLLLGPASTNSLGGHVSCPLISLPFNAGDFFGQWSTTLGPVDLPAAGGTVLKSGSTSGVLTRNAAGTFVGKPN